VKAFGGRLGVSENSIWTSRGRSAAGGVGERVRRAKALFTEPHAESIRAARAARGHVAHCRERVGTAPLSNRRNLRPFESSQRQVVFLAPADRLPSVRERVPIEALHSEAKRASGYAKRAGPRAASTTSRRSKCSAPRGPPCRQRRGWSRRTDGRAKWEVFVSSLEGSRPNKSAGSGCFVSPKTRATTLSFTQHRAPSTAKSTDRKNRVSASLSPVGRTAGCPRTDSVRSKKLRRESPMRSRGPHGCSPRGLHSERKARGYEWDFRHKLGGLPRS